MLPTKPNMLRALREARSTVFVPKIDSWCSAEDDFSQTVSDQQGWGVPVHEPGNSATSLNLRHGSCVEVEPCNFMFCLLCNSRHEGGFGTPARNASSVGMYTAQPSKPSADLSTSTARS